MYIHIYLRPHRCSRFDWPRRRSVRLFIRRGTILI